MRKSQLFKNSTYSMMQTVAMSLAALVLFKLMVTYCGLKEAGLWSFLSSITTITGFGSFGFASALLYYVPQFKAGQAGPDSLNRLVNTGFHSVVGTTLALCVAAFLIFRFVIPSTVEPDLVGKGVFMLPWVIASFFFSGLSAAFYSVLDGLQLMHLRARFQMAGSFLFVLLGWWFLLKWGIVGMAFAQLAQQVFLLISGFVLVRRHLPEYRPAWLVDSGILKSIFRYGFNFQVISITQIVSDPFMKSMLTRFAGSRYTALFDFSVRLLSFVRVLLISANQTLVPKVTEFNTLRQSSRIVTYYKANFRVISLLSVLLFLFPVAISDSISRFFLNERSVDFNFILMQVALGLMVNALAFPAHFHYMGTGKLRWNVLNNLIAATLIIVMTPLLGMTLGGSYMVLSWSLAAVAGSLVLLMAFKRENGISLAPFIDRQLLFLLSGMIMAILVNRYLMSRVFLGIHPLAGFLVSLGVLGLCIIYPARQSQSIRKMWRKLLR